MKKDSLAFHALKNASYSLLGYVWPIFFSIFITPIVVYSLGIKDYGIYLFINALIGTVGLLDLGITAALTRYIAEYSSTRETKRLKNIIKSGNLLFTLIGTIGLTFFLLIATLGKYFNPEFAERSDFYLYAFTLAGLMFFVGALNSIYNIVPIALQRFDIGTKIGMVQLTLQSLGILAMVLIGYGLLSILIVHLITLIIGTVLARIAAHKILPLATLEIGWDKEEVVRCYKFGLTSVVNNIGSSSLNYLDRLLIPIFLGPSMLTYYSLPGNISNKIPGITTNLSGVLFPLTASLVGMSNTESIKNAYVRSFRLLTTFGLAITIPLIAFSYTILEIWLDKDFADKSGGILIILLITGFVLALIGPLSNFLMGLGKIKVLTATSGAMALLNLILLFSLLPLYGIEGAAWSYLLSLLPAAYLFYYIEKNYLNLEGRVDYYFSIFGKNALIGSIVYLGAHFLIDPYVTNLWSLMVVGPFTVLLYLSIYRVAGFFEKEDSDDINGFLKLTLERVGLKKRQI